MSPDPTLPVSRVGGTRIGRSSLEPLTSTLSGNRGQRPVLIGYLIGNPVRDSAGLGGFIVGSELCGLCFRTLAGDVTRIWLSPVRVHFVRSLLFLVRSL